MCQLITFHRRMILYLANTNAKVAKRIWSRLFCFVPFFFQQLVKKRTHALDGTYKRRIAITAQ